MYPLASSEPKSNLQGGFGGLCRSGGSAANSVQGSSVSQGNLDGDVEGRLVQWVINTLSWTEMSHDRNRIQKDFILMGDGPNLTRDGLFQPGHTLSCRGPCRRAGWGRIRRQGGPSGLCFLSSSVRLHTLHHGHRSESRAGLTPRCALGQHCVQTQVAGLRREVVVLLCCCFFFF